MEPWEQRMQDAYNDAAQVTANLNAIDRRMGLIKKSPWRLFRNLRFQDEIRELLAVNDDLLAAQERRIVQNAADIRRLRGSHGAES